MCCPDASITNMYNTMMPALHDGGPGTITSFMSFHSLSFLFLFYVWFSFPFSLITHSHTGVNAYFESRKLAFVSIFFEYHGLAQNSAEIIAADPGWLKTTGMYIAYLHKAPNLRVTPFSYIFALDSQNVICMRY